MDQPRKTNPFVLPIGILTTLVFVAIVTPRAVPGYDASFALAWGRDQVHGLALDFSHPSSPTPHPLVIAVADAAGLLPLRASVIVIGVLTALACAATLALLGRLAWQLSTSLVMSGVTILVCLFSAPLGLLTLAAASDVWFAALGVGAVLLTIRGRHVGAIVTLTVAALIRPEAVVLAMVPLWLAVRPVSGRTASPPRSAPVIVYCCGLLLAIGTWAAMGAAGGDVLIGLHSASTNASVNNNPRGLGTAVAGALPALASPTSWLTVVGALVASIAALISARRAATRPHPRTRGASHPSTTAAAPAPSPTGVPDVRATLITASMVAIGLGAYLGQGMLGTPLVARYLLLPALLCVPLSAATVPLAAARIRSHGWQVTAVLVVAAALAGAAGASNVHPWRDVLSARGIRADLVAQADTLFDSPLLRGCPQPVSVRSPAMVPITALHLGRPLVDVRVSATAEPGVLLQPLSSRAATLAGFGPMTPLQEQAAFPTDAPPRQSSTDWALYSSCRP